MRAETIQQISKTKRICAGLLAVWMSGAVFLVCCGMLTAQTAKIESCPLAKKGHCAKSLTNEDAFRFEAPESDCPEIDCCPFLPQLFQKVRKAESSQQIAISPAKLKINRSSVGFANVKPIALLNYHPRLLNRGETYLKNRVFRI